MNQKNDAKTYADCQGCSLCLLPCPMWRQHRDVMFSPQGFAKSMQHGARAEDLKDYLSSCILCGGCDVMCPENIDLTGMIKKAWADTDLPSLSQQDETELSGFVISCDAWVQQQLTPDDLYIIDAAALHADYERRIEHYTSLREQTGCSMNLDLNRMAIPTGIASEAAKQGAFDVNEQFEWLIRGREFKRVIVEHEADIDVLKTMTDKVVMGVSALLNTLDVKDDYATS
ncbi:MAG: 4Fe-4S dicluster domain-containing protein [Mariprofundaceae bacterium]|nr:4Fe-4S dicluster domain-containing protein [Mariprofundaceae bacterium]